MAGTFHRRTWTALLLERPLPWFLLLQFGLLFHNLDLLPIWGDEQFTLDVVRQPWAAIPPILQADIHPPIYYFLARLWTQLPWPGSGIAELRALSATICLIATVAVDFLWLRNTSKTTRLWFLTLWCLSPTLLMYSRMGRSYSLQLLVSVVAIHLALRFLDEPSSRRRLLTYSLATGALLYTHYLPGLAVAAATALVLALRWIRQRDLLKPLLISNALIALLYLPWVATLAESLSRVSSAQPYWLIQNFALETAVKLAYWFTSFTFEEAFPTWAIALGVVLGPWILWLLRHGIMPQRLLHRQSRRPRWLPLVSVVALIGYLGATAWVTFAFVGARLLFVLPFYLLLLLAGRERRPRAGTVVCAGLLVVSLGSLTAYFGKQGFRNQGYLVPFGEIALYVREHSAGVGSSTTGALMLVEGYNTDPSPLLAALDGHVETIKIRGEPTETLASQRVNGVRLDVIWYLRNTHDISPGGVISRIESEATASYRGKEHLFVPYSTADRWMARLLGWPPQTHHYRLTEFRKPPGRTPNESVPQHSDQENP